MLMTRAIVKKVQADFPMDDQASVLEYLSLYGARDGEAEIERVRLAILTQAGGDKERVIQLVGRAKEDYAPFLYEG